MKRLLIFYGLMAFALLMLFQLSHYWYRSDNNSLEYILGVVAFISIATGIYFGRQFSKTPPPTSSPFEPDQKKIAELGISPREYEVLLCIAKGYSNKEIADELHVSENTVKTHVSNLLVKLDVKRRTQAVSIATGLNIIP